MHGTPHPTPYLSHVGLSGRVWENMYWPGLLRALAWSAPLTPDP
jgi:hypothetical protein